MQIRVETPHSDLLNRDCSALSARIAQVSVSDDLCCEAPALRITNTHRSTDSVVFSYETVVGQTCIIEYKNSLGATAWTKLSTSSGNGAVKSITNLLDGSSQRFFRVRTP